MCPPARCRAAERGPRGRAPWRPIVAAIRRRTGAEGGLCASRKRLSLRAIAAELEQRGLEVKGEICSCDVVGLREGEAVVVVVAELTQRFNLDLVLQGVERSAACDADVGMPRRRAGH